MELKCYSYNLEIELLNSRAPLKTLLAVRRAVCGVLVEIRGVM